MKACASLSTCLVFLVAAVAAHPASAQQLANHLPKRIVGDYGYWSKYATPPYSAAQIPYHKLTHIIHAGVGFDASGTLAIPDGYIEPELVNLAHAAGVKVLMLIAGDFAGIEANHTLTTLVGNVKAAAAQYGYDGVDVDWEYPATTQDRLLLTSLMAQLRDGNPDYVLSIDIAPWGGYGYDVIHLQNSLDFFNIMMFDCAGPWTAYGQLNSPIFWDARDPAPWECNPGGSVEGTATIMLKEIPGKQLNMGTPFYGYVYVNINHLFGLCPNSAWTEDEACDNAVYTENYGTAFKQLTNQRGWQTFYDPVALVPFMVKKDGSPGFITYDDFFSTYYRVWYSDWQRGLGGAFMWSLDADYDGHSQDLLDAMYLATVSGH